MGSGQGQVQFTANGGGFSAVGANRVVNLGGNSAVLTWGGSGSFLQDQAPLVLGTPLADYDGRFSKSPEFSRSGQMDHKPSRSFTGCGLRSS